MELWTGEYTSGRGDDVLKSVRTIHTVTELCVRTYGVYSIPWPPILNKSIMSETPRSWRTRILPNDLVGQVVLPGRT